MEGERISFCLRKNTGGILCAEDRILSAVECIIITGDQGRCKGILIYTPPSIKEYYVMPDTVKIIGFGAFAHNHMLKTVVISDSVNVIAQRAFSTCSNLQTVIISDSVTEIAKNAFFACRSLKIITVPEKFSKAQVKKWGVPKSCKIIRTLNAI